MSSARTRVRNTWPREIPGLTVVVDLNEKKVLRVVDEGVTPVTRALADYDPASIGPARDVPGPMRVDRPLGPGFRVDGHVVEWPRDISPSVLAIVHLLTCLARASLTEKQFSDRTEMASTYRPCSWNELRGNSRIAPLFLA